MADLHILIAIVLVSTAGAAVTNRRFILVNPGDMATEIGYQSHNVPDMSSLVDEASAHAHANGSGTTGGATYNVPNFPGMGQNQLQTHTGNQGSQAGSTGSGSGSAVATSGSASFAGTNHWRCDSHVVDTCDVQCLDVDPKDGCPFCIPTCTGQSGSVYQQPGLSGTNGQGSQSGSVYQQPGLSGTNVQGIQSGSVYQQPGLSGTNVQGSQSGSVYQQPGLSGTNVQGSQSGSVYQQPGLSGTNVQGSQSGNVYQQPGLSGTNTQGSQSGSLSQQQSGLSGTGTQGGAGGAKQSMTTSASIASCSYFPPNCPQIYTILEKGCLVCTLLRQISVANGGTMTNTHAPTTPLSVTCPPKRCVAPCNKGIVLDAAGCPRCLCPAHV